MAWPNGVGERVVGGIDDAEFGGPDGRQGPPWKTVEVPREIYATSIQYSYTVIPHDVNLRKDTFLGVCV